MGIRDILLAKSHSAEQVQPVPVSAETKTVPIPAPLPTPESAPVPLPPPKQPVPDRIPDANLMASIKVGKGTLDQDPESGSIIKLLGENGFRQKMEEGSKNGHTYTIIHNSPSTEFLLIDSWSEGENNRKQYHAFTTKTESKPSTIARPEDHPDIQKLYSIDKELQDLIYQARSL